MCSFLAFASEDATFKDDACQEQLPIEILICLFEVCHNESEG